MMDGTINIVRVFQDGSTARLTHVRGDSAMGALMDYLVYEDDEILEIMYKLYREVTESERALVERHTNEVLRSIQNVGAYAVHHAEGILTIATMED